MAFQSGNKLAVGANHQRPRIITQKLIEALNEKTDKGITRLKMLVDALVNLATTEKDMGAIREILDRIEGKPMQEQRLTIDDKRDGPDWGKAELVAFLDDARARSGRVAEAAGSVREPDSVH